MKCICCCDNAESHSLPHCCCSHWSHTILSETSQTSPYPYFFDFCFPLSLSLVFCSHFFGHKFQAKKSQGNNANFSEFSEGVSWNSCFWKL